MYSIILVVVVISTILSTTPSFALKNVKANLKLKNITLLRSFSNSIPLELCEENVQIVIEEIKNELGTIFGYDAGSRAVGISGEIDLVEIDGPNIVISLKGRFWHSTDVVLLRVESFLKQRIPEVIDVTLDMSKSNIIDDNRLNTGDGPKKMF